MRILVVTASYGQPDSPASNHITDRVQCLREYPAISLSVITDRQPCTPQSISVTAVGGKPRVGRGLIRHVPPAVREALRGCRDRLSVLTHGAPTDRFGNWDLIPVYVAAITDALTQDTYDLVYSTGGSAVVHIAVASVLQEIKVPWIAEIQDPLLFDGIDNYDPSLRDLEYLSRGEACLAAADVLVCLTESCKTRYRNHLGLPQVYSLYPGSGISPIPAFPDSKVPGKTVIYHAGTLAGDRNLDVLIKAVQGAEDQVVICLAGYVSEPIRQRISALPYIRCLGIVSRDVVASQIAGSDVCVVVQNQNPVSQYTIPSKFYDYTALSAPTLFLGYKNDEAHRNSAQYGFYYCDQADPEWVSACLRQVIRDHRMSMLRVPKDPEIRAATSTFVDICRKTLLCGGEPYGPTATSL
ncbi:MAG: hypothetical protein WC343_13080 [Bacilli bacterium]|jgi:hypothetical protein